MTILVRDAIRDDLSFIFHGNQQMAFETEGKELDPATLQSGVDAALADSQRGQYLVAEIDGEAAGTLFITKEWSDWRNGFFWWIQSVYVLPRFRGQGVYSALHGEVVNRAEIAEADPADENVCGVRLYVDRGNERARRLYEKLGMEVSHYDQMEQSIPKP